MTHTLVVQPKAERDIRHNAIWLRRTFSPRTADRWNDGIIAAIAALTKRPEQHPEADEACELGPIVRCKLHGRRPHVYRILFTVTDDTVLVLRVLHAAQDRLTEDNL